MSIAVPDEHSTRVSPELDTMIQTPCQAGRPGNLMRGLGDACAGCGGCPATLRNSQPLHTLPRLTCRQGRAGSHAPRL